MSDLICDGIFDARLVRENKSAKGIFWTIEIAADDYFRAKLENLRPNALLKLGYQELIDTSVQPINGQEAGEATATKRDHASALRGAVTDPVAGGEHSATAGYHSATAGAVEFRAPATNTTKPRVQSLSSQCALRCKDKRFWEWVDARYSGHPSMYSDEASVAQFVRDYCGVKSRSEIDSNQIAGDRWNVLSRNFDRHLTEQMHAGSYR